MCIIIRYLMYSAYNYTCIVINMYICTQINEYFVQHFKGFHNILTWKFKLCCSFTYFQELTQCPQIKGGETVKVHSSELATNVSFKASNLEKVKEISSFYAPGLKGPPGVSSNRIVRLSVHSSIPLTKCNI